MNYLFTGLTGLRNRGVEALVVCALEQIAKRDQNAHFKILTTDLKYDRHAFEGKGIEVLEHSTDLFETPSIPSRAWLKRRLQGGFVHDRNIRKAMEWADFVIASGGDMFASDYGLKSLKLNLVPLTVANAMGKKTIFLGHSIGPFKTQEELDAWTEVARGSALVTLREGKSYRYVSDALKGNGPRVVHTADVAFLLRPDPGADSLFAAQGLAPDRAKVAMSISGGITKFSGADRERHLTQWVSAINYFVNEQGCDVLIVPHVQEVSTSNNDLIAITNVIRKLDAPTASHVRVAGLDLRAGEFKALITRCDFLVAERMHAAIAGLSTGVPTFVVGYSVKAYGILEDIFGDSSKDYLISIGDFCSAQGIPNEIKRAWTQRAETKAALDAARPKLVAAANANFDALFSLKP